MEVLAERLLEIFWWRRCWRRDCWRYYDGENGGEIDDVHVMEKMSTLYLEKLAVCFGRRERKENE